MVLRPLLGYARDLLSSVLQPGDVAVDGTVGNGIDTLFLAEQVGADGRVFGFDIQEQALLNARQRLSEGGVSERVELVLESHAKMRECLPEEWHGKVKAVTFNLGYLPGGDESVVTQESSTVAALQAGLELMAPGGVMTVMVYVGHPEGKDEASAVMQWAEALERKDADVLLYRFLNRKSEPPVLVVVEKK